MVLAAAEKKGKDEKTVKISRCGSLLARTVFQRLEEGGEREENMKPKSLLVPFVGEWRKIEEKNAHDRLKTRERERKAFDGRVTYARGIVSLNKYKKELWRGETYSLYILYVFYCTTTTTTTAILQG